MMPCMLFKSHLKHTFTQFRIVYSFRLGFIGIWVNVAIPLF